MSEVSLPWAGRRGVSGSLRAPRWVNVSLLLFLSFSLLLPWKAVYGVFLFAGVFPGVLWVCIAPRSRRLVNDRTIWLALAMLGYMTVGTFLPDGLKQDEQFQVVRWALSTSIFMLAVFVAAQRWLDQPRYHARLIVSVAFVASLLAIAHYFWAGQYPSRISGFGYLSHPILGPSALIAFWAVGMVTYRLDENRERFDHLVMGLSALSILILVILSQSRGPLGALLAFMVLYSASVLLVSRRARARQYLVGGVILALVFAAAAYPFLSDLLAGMVARGFSHRPQIWMTVIQNPPESIWIGAGAASDFRNSEAGLLLHEQMGVAIKHPHDLLLSAWHYSGFIGAGLLLLLLGWVLVRIVRQLGTAHRRLVPFALLLLLLIGLLNLTDGHMVIAPPSPDWLFFWLPLAYLMALARCCESRGE